VEACVFLGFRVDLRGRLVMLSPTLFKKIMEKYITPYEIFQLEKYGNIHI
jgi:hypothetical protein